MARHTDLGSAQRCRIEVSMTRSESVAIVVEGPLDDFPRGFPSNHKSPPAPTDSRLSRLPMPLSLEPSRKLLERKRK